MELEELIENTLRRKHLEEMMARPEKEHTPLEGMDNEQIKRFALFLFEENQNKSNQLDEMIVRLDEIGKDLKESNKKIDSLTNALLKANSKAEKVVLEYKLRNKEYKALEKKYNALIERLSLINAQVYASSKSLKGIDRKKTVKGKHDDKDDFDGTPTAPSNEVPQSDSTVSSDTHDTPFTTLSKERPYRKGMTYNKSKLTSDEIFRKRDNKETTEIIDKIRTELYDLLANPDESRSELMSKALNYMKNFWNQIFAYRNDGEYSIDNMAAERAIRPITVQRLCCTPHNLPYVGKIFMLAKNLIYCIIEHYDICSQHKYYLESHKN